MPPTPLHILPSSTVYLLAYRYLHGIAFYLATLLIDIEPALHLIFDIPPSRIPMLWGGYTLIGAHTITHNPLGIFILIAPTMTILAKLLERTKPFWLKIFEGADWTDYSWKRTYLSGLIGGFLHLGWDVTMHEGINLGFPFIYIPNFFRSDAAFYFIGILSLLLILPSYIIGKRNNKGSPFRKLP